LSPELRSCYRLGEYEDYFYLPEWVGTPEGTPFNNKESLTALAAEWQEQQQAMFQVGFADDERDDLAGLLVAILHVGNVEFESPDSEDTCQLSEGSQAPLNHAADAMCVDSVQLDKAMRTGIINTRGEVIETQYTARKASEVRDSLTKAIYAKIFSWLVKRIDAVLASDRSRGSASSLQAGSMFGIGILDIFGFEDFEVNGFDQLLINLANENLHNFFNNHIFSQELEEFQKEELDPKLYQGIKYEDNVKTLELFTARQPAGLFALLNEESRLAKATPQTMVQKFKTNLASHTSFKATRDNDSFTVCHFAGDVTYDALGFLEKNADKVPDLIENLLSTSSNPLLRFFFNEFGASMVSRAKTVRAMKSKRFGGKSKHGHGKSRHRNKSKHSNGPPSTASPRDRGRAGPKKAVSVASSFVVSLRMLMAKLSKAQPHFIRCIKPNKAKVAGEFDGTEVLRQMRYNGMLATVKMRRAGFPQRIPFPAFMAKYKGLSMAYTAPSPQSKDDVTTFMKALEDRHAELQKNGRMRSQEEEADEGFSNSGARRVETAFSGWVVGNSKIFLKHWHTEILNTMNTVNQRAAINLQSWTRMIQQRRRYVVMARRAADEAAEAATFLAGFGKASTAVWNAFETITDEEARRGPEGLGIVKKEKKKKIKKADIQMNRKRFEKEREKGKKAVVKWWMKSERPRNMHVSTNGHVRLYFHGMISRAVAEDYLAKSQPGTFLVRVSERYFGYAVSARLARRVKHYKVVVFKDGYSFEGVQGHHTTIHDMILHYSQTPLPSRDASSEFLQYPLNLVHNLNLGIDHHNEISKDGGATTVADAAQVEEGLPGAAVEGAAVAQPREVDDTVFEGGGPLAASRRWMRGTMSRDDAEKELRERGMASGRFLVRVKERTERHIMLALSYTENRRFYHHILGRKKGVPWALDNKVLLVNHKPYMGPLVGVIGELQERQAPQIITILERDGIVQHTADDRLAGGNPRPLEISSTSVSPKSRRRSAAAATSPDGAEEIFNQLTLGRQKAEGRQRRGHRPGEFSLLVSPELAGGARVSPSALGNISEVAAEAAPAPAPNVKADTLRQSTIPTLYRTGKAETPRCIINAKSTMDDVSLWLVSIGLARLVGKFYKKKVDGNKLFLMTEKQFRKVVKSEDDFVLFKRALRQAVSYALTTPDVGNDTMQRRHPPTQSNPAFDNSTARQSQLEMNVARRSQGFGAGVNTTARRSQLFGMPIDTLSA